ncbi:hypothetical protein JOQ06_001438, partial [Pogonophryne albipinna]
MSDAITLFCIASREKSLLTFSGGPRLESPLSPRAIDMLALPRLTRGFVCCGRHSRLSPD